MVIALDSSTSLQERNWLLTLNATTNFIQGLEIDSGNVRIGLVIFSNDAESVFHLNTFRTKSEIIRKVSQIKYKYGQTNLADTMKLIRTQMFIERNGDRRGIPNIAVIVTDGNSTVNIDSTIDEARKTRDNGIQVYAIGVGFEIDTKELDGITGTPQNRYLIDHFDELETKMETIYITLCPGIVCMYPSLHLIT